MLNAVSANDMLMLDSDIWLYANITEDLGNITYTLHFPKNFWIGIGYGPTMTNTPMFIFQPDINPDYDKFNDTWSTRHTHPTVYDEKMYSYKEIESGDEDYYRYEITRKLNITRRANESNVITLDQRLDGCWAYKEGDFGYHGRSNRGGYTMFARSDGTVVFNTVDSGTFYEIHGIIMYISWSILSFLAITSARYMKHLYKYKMIIHSSAGTLITTNTVIIVWLSLTEYKVKDSELKYGHRAIGIIVMVFVLLQFFGGMAVRQSSILLKWKTKYALAAKMIHRLLGFAIVILANFQVMGGLYNFESPVKKLIFVHWALYVVMLFGFELLYRFRYVYKSKGVINAVDVPDISYEKYMEFIRNGRKLVLFNNFIIDVENFMSEHPGSRFVIEQNIGNDIGQFFYGAYSVEQEVAPHIHSNFAAMIMKKLAVGKLIIAPPKPITYINDISNQYVQTIVGGDVEFTVQNNHAITSSISRITFHSMNCNIDKTYPNLKFAGKSFSVTSLQNFVSRYYTICNCMGSLLYDEYLKVMNAALSNQRYVRSYSSYEELNQKSNDCLELVIKHYPQSQTGISTQVHNAEVGDKFYIHGPVGRGLELNINNSLGLNIIFVGGTGILPFMDLFAYILRKLLAENDREYEMFPGETFDDLAETSKFIIYAYFPTRSESIGIDFLEKVENLHKKYGKGEKFKVNVIFTREEDEKLSDEELLQLLQDHKYTDERINKLWICGPPPMNQQFNKLSGEIKEKTGLDFEDFYIL